MLKSSRRTQHAAVNLVALEVHRRAGFVLCAYLDTRRVGEVMERLRGLPSG